MESSDKPEFTLDCYGEAKDGPQWATEAQATHFSIFFLFQGLCEPIALISQGCAAAEKVDLHLGPSRGLIVYLSCKAWGFACI